MLIRFIYQGIVGLIAAILIIFLGDIGALGLIPLALYPIIWRLQLHFKKNDKKLDERELLLFYKIGNISLGLIILMLVTIHFASGISINGNLIGENWMILSVSTIVFLQGLVGFIIFRIN